MKTKVGNEIIPARTLSRMGQLALLALGEKQRGSMSALEVATRTGANVQSVRIALSEAAGHGLVQVSTWTIPILHKRYSLSPRGEPFARQLIAMQPYFITPTDVIR